MISVVTASPYRSHRRALAARRRALLDELEEALAERGRRGRRRARRLRVAVEKLERDMDHESNRDAHGPRRRGRRSRLVLGVLTAILVGGLLVTLGRPRDTSAIDAHAFDPNAIDGADTTPRVELQAEQSSR